jgi:hypothetical protein
MPSPAHKSSDLTPEELADRTLELDMRWLQYDDTERPAKPRDAATPQEDPTVVLDLTATQVHDLLTNKK